MASIYCVCMLVCCMAYSMGIGAAARLKPSLLPTGRAQAYPSVHTPNIVKDLSSMTFETTQSTRMEDDLYFCEYQSTNAVTNRAFSLASVTFAPVYRFQIRTPRIIMEEHEWIISVSNQKLCEPNVLFHGRRLGTKRSYQAYLVSSETLTSTTETDLTDQQVRIRFTLTYQLHSKVPHRYKTLPLEYLNTRVPFNRVAQENSYIGFLFQDQRCMTSYDHVKISRYQTNDCGSPQRMHLMTFDPQVINPSVKKEKAFKLRPKKSKQAKTTLFSSPSSTMDSRQKMSAFPQETWLLQAPPGEEANSKHVLHASFRPAPEVLSSNFQPKDEQIEKLREIFLQEDSWAPEEALLQDHEEIEAFLQGKDNVPILNERMIFIPS